MKPKLTPLNTALALMIGSGSVLAEIHVYSTIPLIGTEEVPMVVSDGYGALTAIFDEASNTLYYGFEWRLGEGSEATAAHFHGPALRGGNAGVRVNLGTVSGKSGKNRGMITLSDNDEAELLAGQWYINIHTNTNPSGELRGQVVELSPADSAAVYSLGEEKLRLESVIVPGAGVYDVELERIHGREPLSLELSTAERKNLDASSSSTEN